MVWQREKNGKQHIANKKFLFKPEYRKKKGEHLKAQMKYVKKYMVARRVGEKESFNRKVRQRKILDVGI